MKKIKNIHPGEILLEEFLEPLGISQYKLANAIGVSYSTISRIVNGKQSVTADIAIRFSKFFGTSAELWLGLQNKYDIEEALMLNEKEYMKRIPHYEKVS